MEVGVLKIEGDRGLGYSDLRVGMVLIIETMDLVIGFIILIS